MEVQTIERRVHALLRGLTLCITCVLSFSLHVFAQESNPSHLRFSALKRDYCLAQGPRDVNRRPYLHQQGDSSEITLNPPTAQKHFSELWPLSNGHLRTSALTGSSEQSRRSASWRQPDTRAPFHHRLRHAAGSCPCLA